MAEKVANSKVNYAMTLENFVYIKIHEIAGVLFCIQWLRIVLARHRIYYSWIMYVHANSYSYA